MLECQLINTEWQNEKKNHLFATTTIQMDLGKNHQQRPKGVGARVWWGTDLHSLKVSSHKLLKSQERKKKENVHSGENRKLH